MTFTDHAKKRMQQRGFKYEYVEFILANGRHINRPGGAIEVRLDKKRAGKNLKEKFFNRQIIDKCKFKAVLLSRIGCVITLYNLN